MNPCYVYRLQKCFDPNPDLRWSCAELLKHDYFAGYQFRYPEEQFNQRRPPSAHLPQLETGGAEPRRANGFMAADKVKQGGCLPTLS